MHREGVRQINVLILLSANNKVFRWGLGLEAESCDGDDWLAGMRRAATAMAGWLCGGELRRRVLFHHWIVPD